MEGCDLKRGLAVAKGVVGRIEITLLMPKTLEEVVLSFLSL